MTAVLTPPPVAPPVPQAQGLSHSNPPGSQSISEDLASFRAGLFPFTWDNCLQLMRLNIIPKDTTIELLDGLLVYRNCAGADRIGDANGAEHDYTVRMIGQVDRYVDTNERHLVTQLTLHLSESYGPLPDATVLRGLPTVYRHRHPTPADALSVIEVADSSYARDAGEKLAAYAAAGIPQYVIIDLPRRLAEVYANPDQRAGTYPPPTVVPADGSIALWVGDGQTVAVPLAELLP